MTSKYDRSIEDMERARINPETAGMTAPYGVGAVVGYGDPSWVAAAQNRAAAAAPYFSHPFYGQQIPIPYSQQQIAPGMFSPAFAGQQSGLSQQGFVPGSFQNLQGQQPLPTYAGILPYAGQQPLLHPLFGMQNPFLYLNPYNQIPLQNLYGAQPWLNPYQGIHPQFFQGAPGTQFETPWLSGGESLQRSQFLRQGSRAFGRPPRSYKRSDELIRDEICKRLALTSEIDATDLDVIVKDGEVTLKGMVDDRFAKRIVEDITETTFGVRDVVNDIRIASRFADPDVLGGGSGKGKEK